VAQVAPRQLVWRRAPYEFESDRPAIDLLTGGPECRTALAAAAAGGGGAPLDACALDAWIESWPADEESFRRERRGILLYPEPALPEAPARGTGAGPGSAS
jgi:hypothetical protein